MTILTNKARESALASALAATFIPAQRKAIEKSMSDAVRKVVVAAVPKEFTEGTKGMPDEWFHWCVQESIPREYNVQAVWDAQPLRWCMAAVFERVKVPSNYNLHLTGEEWKKLLGAQLDAALKLQAKYEALKQELADFLNSCKTFEAVIKGMPELERHLPPIVKKSFPLVADTRPLKKALKGMGFDTAVKEAA